MSATPGIGMLREGPLHASLKELLAEPGDRLEVAFERFVIDLVRANGELVEVQTGSFGALGKKLDVLLDTHRIRIVHPIAAERRIVRVDEHGEVLSMRKAPRRSALEVFDELVAFPSLLTHPNLTLELLLLREDHIRGPEPIQKRRRKRDPGERRLREVLDRVELHRPADLRQLFSTPLPEAAFTTRELASAQRCRLVLAQRIVYCLKANGLLEPAGNRGRAPLHRPTG